MCETRKQVTESDSMEMRRLHQIEGMRTKEIVKKYKKKGYSRNVFFAPLKSLCILYIPETRFHCKYIINNYMYLFLIKAIIMHKITTVTHGHMTVTWR